MAWWNECKKFSTLCAVMFELLTDVLSNKIVDGKPYSVSTVKWLNMVSADMSLNRLATDSYSNLQSLGISII